MFGSNDEDIAWAEKNLAYIDVWVAGHDVTLLRRHYRGKHFWWINPSDQRELVDIARTVGIGDERKFGGWTKGVHLC